MTKFRTIPLYALIVCLCLTITACQKKEESAPPPKDEFKALEAPLQELEAGLLEVMARADLVPYYEKQIQAKKQHDEKQKAEAAQTAGGSQTAPPPPPEEYKPEPITINDTLLTETIKQETPKEQKKEETLPEDIVFVWHEINSGITKLHGQWNELRPKLSSANVEETALTDFGTALNNLTIAGTEKKYMETLQNANAATGHFADFMKASKDGAQPALYKTKYYAREIVLNAANADYTAANENFQKLKVQSDSLGAKLIEKDAKDNAAKLKTAVDDLESALKVQDLNLLKIETSVLVKDLTEIKEKLAEK